MIVVADTSAMLALHDRDEQHHCSLREIFIANRASWVVPSAVLPELDFLAARRFGADARAAVLADLARGEYEIAWADGKDLARAVDLTRQYTEPCGSAWWTAW